MRVIFYTFLSILGISFSLVILMPSLFDINNYKGKVENLFYNKTNNTLKIAGNISLSFLSGLRLSVKDISFVSNDGENLFQSEELLISPKFFPLLKGELLFNSVKIVKPTIYITKKKNEKYNWEIAFSKNKKGEIKQDSTRDIKNKDNKNNQGKLNPLNINSLHIVNALILTNIENKKNKFEDINIRLNYKNNSEYSLEGNISYKEDKIKFSYDINYLNENINLRGFINGKGLELNNNTNIDANSISGESDIDLKINNFSNFVKNNYLRDQSLKLDAKVSFTDKSIKFNNGKLINKKTLVNFKGDLIKKNKINIVRVYLTTDMLDLDKLLLFSNNKKPIEVQDEKNNIKDPDKSKQYHIVDNIFKTLKFYDIKGNFTAKEIVYKSHNIKKVEAEFSKKNNLNISANLNSNFVEKLTVKSKINKKKLSTFVINAKNLNIKKVNDYMGFSRLSGALNFSIEGNTNVKDKNSILKQLNGELKLNTKNILINDLNLKKLKSSILDIKNVEDLLELNKNVFKGNTSIKNQEMFVEIKNGNLKLPKTDILLDDNKITATGLYELAPNNININLNYNNENNKLLSLFNVNFKGNIKNIQTSLDYNKAKTDQLLGDILEKKMKKVIKDKLDNKFNDIIENLLE